MPRPSALCTHGRRILKLLRIALVVALAALAQRPDPQQAREDAYRANNVGVALLEQFNYARAAGSFRDALRIDPSLALARLNLAIALLYQPDLDAAAREAGDAVRLLPRDPR